LESTSEAEFDLLFGIDQKSADQGHRPPDGIATRPSEDPTNG